MLGSFNRRPPQEEAGIKGQDGEFPILPIGVELNYPGDELLKRLLEVKESLLKT